MLLKNAVTATSFTKTFSLKMLKKSFIENKINLNN